ncbi:hypothetical protein TVAG_219700 [Trichomonas vaginalis G3]|uniref:Uncharacterized protein n=1 Tax=Trichomonas vaginalis (strain ATCC PRA-98 / G3) TaxID=412133 RepID=A2DXS8_TRIV3|nr:hypothetical protein TVAGG3_0683380 [Trichomonas vaginalis G3]EAY14788.1 hypothetical protein TVAG_219700 [Trichomonas vaginalis G3]KAI5508063.1 hypothetical protein TVAGG3_0683380 [Trichomonas vaginalis G3]|eukprot:XP_001327011.1 hypothetical protein [Trichomonas vaginalis G3]
MINCTVTEYTQPKYISNCFANFELAGFEFNENPEISLDPIINYHDYEFVPQNYSYVNEHKEEPLTFPGFYHNILIKNCEFTETTDIYLIAASCSNIKLLEIENCKFYNIASLGYFMIFVPVGSEQYSDYINISISDICISNCLYYKLFNIEKSDNFDMESATITRCASQLTDLVSSIFSINTMKSQFITGINLSNSFILAFSSHVIDTNNSTYSYSNYFNLSSVEFFQSEFHVEYYCNFVGIMLQNMNHAKNTTLAYCVIVDSDHNLTRLLALQECQEYNSSDKKVKLIKNDGQFGNYCKNKMSAGAITAIVLGFVIALMLLVTVLLLFIIRRINRSNNALKNRIDLGASIVSDFG